MFRLFSLRRREGSHHKFCVGDLWYHNADLETLVELVPGSQYFLEEWMPLALMAERQPSYDMAQFAKYLRALPVFEQTWLERAYPTGNKPFADFLLGTTTAKVNMLPPITSTPMAILNGSTYASQEWSLDQFFIDREARIKEGLHSDEDDAVVDDSSTERVYHGCTRIEDDIRYVRWHAIESDARVQELLRLKEGEHLLREHGFDSDDGEIDTRNLFKSRLTHFLCETPESEELSGPSWTPERTDGGKQQLIEAPENPPATPKAFPGTESESYFVAKTQEAILRIQGNNDDEAVSRNANNKACDQNSNLNLNDDAAISASHSTHLDSETASNSIIGGIVPNWLLNYDYQTLLFGEGSYL